MAMTDIPGAMDITEMTDIMDCGGVGSAMSKSRDDEMAWKKFLILLHSSNFSFKFASS